MYKCNDCGGEFEEPETYGESRPVGFEKFSVCPYCGFSNYEEKPQVKKEIDKYSVAAGIIPVIARLNRQLDNLHESAVKMFGANIRLGVTPLEKVWAALMDILTEMAAPAILSDGLNQRLETVTEGQACEEVLAMYADEVGL